MHRNTKALFARNTMIIYFYNLKNKYTNYRFFYKPHLTIFFFLPQIISILVYRTLAYEQYLGDQLNKIVNERQGSQNDMLVQIIVQI